MSEFIDGIWAPAAASINLLTAGCWGRALLIGLARSLTIAFGAFALGLLIGIAGAPADLPDL